MRNADCLRNISNPNDPNADTEIANTFGTSEYNSNTNVYYRSGILSHWFYWLSVGGSGINGLGNEYNVYGIGIEAAADLIYHAQSEGFLIGTTSYSLMRTNIVNAADDLYGENSIQSLQVENAWYAMGVGTYPGQAEISGPSITCSSGASYSISNLPPGATITWSTGSPITRVSSQGSNPCTFKSSGSGEGWIQATIDTGFGAITLPRQTVWGGIVLPLDLRLRDRFTGMFKWELCKSEANPVNADHTGGEAHIDDWGWDVSGGYISYDNPYGDNSMVTLRPLSTSFTVELRAHNACGWSEWADMGVSVIYCGGWYMTLYPNPAKDVVTLSFETADEAKTTEGKTRLESKGAREKELQAYSVQIWSEEKGMVKSIQSDEKEIQIPLHGLEKGKYYLHLIYNDKTYKEVLFVE